MHKFFVCEEGPMGGISIVFVAASYADALVFLAQNGKGRDLYIYKQVLAP